MIDVSSVIAELNLLVSQSDAAVKKAHDDGFAEGVASVAVPAQIVTQADVDAAVARLKAEILAVVQAGEANIELLLK